MPKAVAPLKLLSVNTTHGRGSQFPGYSKNLEVLGREGMREALLGLLSTDGFASQLAGNIAFLLRSSAFVKEFPHVVIPGRGHSSRARNP